jgi:hypothetical protein
MNGMTPSPQGTDPSNALFATLRPSDEVITGDDLATLEEGCRLIVATLDRVPA